MRKKTVDNENPFWMSIGDLMSGLLFAFILVAVASFIILADSENTKIRVFSLLEQEFKQSGIEALIDPKSGTLAISDNLLFGYDSAELTPQGRAYLDKFGPAIARVLNSIAQNGEYDEIYAIDIEGYTSERIDEKAVRMMDLSVRRSNAVWRYLYIRHYPHKDSLVKKMRVSGWGNIKASSIQDLAQDRKVVFQIQFRDFYDKLHEQTRELSAIK